MEPAERAIERKHSEPLTPASRAVSFSILFLGLRFAPPQALRCRPLRGLKP